MPLQSLTFAVVDGPPGQIDPVRPEEYPDYLSVGRYRWLVPDDTPMSTIDVTIRATDSGSPQHTFEMVVPIAIIAPFGAPYNAPLASPDRYTIDHAFLANGGVYSGGNLMLNDTPAWSWYNGNWYIGYPLGFPGEWGPPQIELVQQAAHGTVVINPNGDFAYTLTGAPFAGRDRFSYRITQLGFSSHTTTVDLDVINYEPDALNHSYHVAQGDVLNVPAAEGMLTDRRVDAEGDITAASVVLPPAHGTLSWNPDGSFIYTPDAGFHGLDTLVYRIDEANPALIPYFHSQLSGIEHYQGLHPDRAQHGIVTFLVSPLRPTSTSTPTTTARSTSRTMRSKRTTRDGSRAWSILPRCGWRFRMRSGARTWIGS